MSYLRTGAATGARPRRLGPCGRTPLRVLGRLRGLIYAELPGRGAPPRTFIHFMETPPLLACDRSGRQLLVVGGRYRVTRRGIEG